MSKNKRLTKLLENIEKDRKSTEKLLEDVSNQILQASPGKKEDFYRNMGPVAGKYLEVLQKINEQHMKAISSLGEKHKDEDENGNGEEDEESEETYLGKIYDSIENANKN